MKAYKKTLSLSVLLALGIGVISGVYADSSADTEIEIAVSDGVLSIDMVTDAGVTVGAPGVALGNITSSFIDTDSIGTLGVTDERIAVYNPRDNEVWISRIAATGGPGTNWSDGASYTMAFDSTAGAGNGTLEVDATAATVEQAVINPANGQFTGFGSAGAFVNANSSAQTFANGSLDNIMLFEATAGADDYAVFTLTGVTLTQNVPSAQEGADYTIDLTLEVY